MPGKTIFLTGATGFVGGAILDELLTRGHRVRALSRSKPIDRDGVTTVQGDLFDDGALDAGLREADAVIHLVGIIREHPKRGQTFERIHHRGAVNVIEAAKRNHVRRFVHMSALGVRADSPSAYASTKARAEQRLKDAGLDWTILRPSIIHGAGGEFMRMAADWCRGRAAPYLFMPFFGSGLLGQAPALLQPIHVADVARAFVDCLDKPQTIGQTIDLVGPQRITWPKLYDTVCHALRGKGKVAIGIPIWYARLLTRITPAPLLPFNRSQVEMAGEDNVGDLDRMTELLGWRPRPFDPAEYASALA